METDLNKINKMAKEKEDENWEFRAFLKGHYIKNLDSIVHGIFKEISGRIDCTTCGNCCKVIQPILKKNDIAKLSKSLSIPLAQFKKKFIQKDEDGDNVFNNLPCPFLKGNKCDHYDSRPADCVSYPHLHKKDFTFRLIGVVNNYSVCPIVFNVYERLKNELYHEFIEFQEEFYDF